MGLKALLLQACRGMSRKNRLIAVPPLSANVSSTSTSGATRVSSRALSR
jgi:hypothetical protein